MKFETNETENTIPQYTQKMKYLVTNLTKYIQDLCEKDDKTLMNKSKELNEWKDIPRSQIKTQY